MFKDPDKNPPLMTYAHHPHLAYVFSQFNVRLFSTSMPPVRQRQIPIMLTGICKATYRWSSHLNTSLECGLDAEVLKSTQNRADDLHFTDVEGTVI
jgi:4-carboxymuconolactone decarboxylase